jgi:hypothetical protein
MAVTTWPAGRSRCSEHHVIGAPRAALGVTWFHQAGPVRPRDHRWTTGASRPHSHSF